MATLPEQKSTTYSSSKYDISIGNNIPVWKSLSGSWLQANGWLRVGEEYHKGSLIIKYDGVRFKIGEIKFQWVEQLNEYINNGKTPEE